eukprot:Blabericola_migrator_1__12514@NODE_792_length_6486_cov_25_403022_g561_i0_p4_GENE_NODE_792_length_6486_cov_25_403022_g561_i0NODE_792_length_6486_cov_25_403022_g561_i0_p4_ORF_typecomplete_len138_score26_33_NODE_792_length_6486_cov_25_403022_g561_i0132545
MSQCNIHTPMLSRRITSANLEIASKDTERLPSKDSLVASSNLHIDALLESAPPSPLEEKLTHFVEYDWHDIEKLLEGGEIDSVETSDLIGDKLSYLWETHEGAVLLSLVLRGKVICPLSSMLAVSLGVHVMSRMGGL